MDKYFVQILWDEEDKIFVARVPELEGVATHGKTRAEAAKRAEVAIALHLKILTEMDEPIPKPVSEKEFSGNMSLRMGTERHEIAAVHAIAKNKSLNEYIIELIDRDAHRDQFEQKLATTAELIEGLFAQPLRASAESKKAVADGIEFADQDDVGDVLDSLKPETRTKIVKKLWAYTIRQNLRPAPSPKKEKVQVSVGMLKQQKGRSVVTKMKKK